MKSSNHWEKIGRRSHCGICLPLSSLHTKQSCGIGEFFDLLPLIDWCARVSFDVIQLLPLFDTGDDPSPYNPLSSCALNPIYLSLAKLPNAPSIAMLLPLSSSQHIQHGAVLTQKLAYLNSYFHANFDPKDASYQHFVQSRSWLLPYARYKAARDQTSSDFHCFLQYLCFQQLSQVHQYAASKKVFLKGDIPYLLNPQSVDVLEEPQLFNLQMEAGAPPDYYNPKGQNWGCPLYHWDVMKKDHFRWWKERMDSVLPYYDIYRLDHVVGLFRIWGMKRGRPAKEGHFFPEDPALWPQHGKELLQLMLEASPLLPIAEDLGTVPEEARTCLKELGIPGTKVIRWERKWQTDRHFIPFDQYEPFSLTTCSTMDSDTLVGWWENSPEEAADFAHFMHWNYTSKLSFERQKAILRASYHTPSYFHINMLQDLLALYPELVWPTPQEERINIPGTVQPTNWAYRCKPSVDEIAAHAGLCHTLYEILH